MKLTWLGHSAVHLETAACGILLDPYLTGNPSCPEHCEDRLGLVVHGPLQATVLMQLATDALGEMTRFSFRSTRALICGQEAVFWAERKSNGMELGAIDASGASTMTARAE